MKEYTTQMDAAGIAAMTYDQRREYEYKQAQDAERKKIMGYAKIGGGVIAAFFCLILLASFWPVRSVPTGTRGVITIGGSIKRIESEGFLLVAPWQRLTIFSIRAEEANVKRAQGATNDQQPVDTDLTVRYAISPDKVGEVFEQYSHDGDLTSYVNTGTTEVFKSVTANYSAPDLISKRPQVSADIYAALTKKLAIYGARVINIDMTNFAFSPSYMNAINEKVTQEQLRQGAENKLKTVEAEQKQKVAVAEAEASAARAKADGDAYAQLKVATAQADALKVQNAALAQNKDVLQLRQIEVSMEQAKRWDGKLPQNMYSSAPVPFLNLAGAK